MVQVEIGDLGSGRVAFITGAGSGMGRACAKAFARAGAKLVLCDINEAGLKETIKECNIPESDYKLVPLDIRDSEALTDLIKSVPATFGRLDYAVNCAGTMGKMNAPFLDDTEANWNFVLDINLRAQVVAIREQIRVMLQQEPLPSTLTGENRTNTTRGCIVNFSSHRGFHGHHLEMPYTATKHAMIGLSRSAAVGYASQGIRVNQLCPGYIVTPMSGAFKDTTNGAVDAFVDNVLPIRRGGSPDEVADLVMYLCSERASYIVGESVMIDGGMHAGL